MSLASKRLSFGGTGSAAFGALGVGARAKPKSSPKSLPKSSPNSWAATGLAVCRAAAVSDPVTAMCARFPVVRRLLGEETFIDAVRRFVVAEPAKASLPWPDGDDFPDFLRRLGNDAPIRYVADIADLEAAHGRARYAATAAHLSPNAFTAIPAGRLAGMRLSLHPSVALLQSAFPIVSVWRACREASNTAPPHWHAEAALIARPDREVEVWGLLPGGFRFLSALSRGLTLAAAAEAALDEASAFDLAANLSLLAEAGITVAIW